MSKKRCNVNERITRFIFADHLSSYPLKSNYTSLCNKRIENLLMHDLRGNYVLSLKKPKTTSYGLSSFSNVSAKLRNALPDFTRTTEFTGFERESRVAFCTAAFLFN